jgi:glutamine---fructose-6-phosphate transaminase (isomerizing)
MSTRGNYTQTEILSQPKVWAAALQTFNHHLGMLQGMRPAQNYSQILFTGCGSTYYLSLAAASLLQELAGLPARGLPASEIWLEPQAAYPWGLPGGAALPSLLVAVSRSGETTETLRACQAFLERGHGDLLTLSCYPEQPLASLGRWNLVFPEAQEESMAQTRAFTTLYLATVGLAACWSGRIGLLEELAALPALAKQVLEQASRPAEDLGRSMELERFYFLGSGSRYGLACELSLKMKEMTLSHSEPFHFMEFRHGPQSMVDEHTLMVGLVSQANALSERKLLAEMQRRGARVLEIGEDGAGVAFHSGLGQATTNPLYLLVGQRLAFERSIAKGLDPDRPHNLQAVIKLE